MKKILSMIIVVMMMVTVFAISASAAEDVVVDAGWVSRNWCTNGEATSTSEPDGGFHVIYKLLASDPNTVILTCTFPSDAAAFASLRDEWVSNNNTTVNGNKASIATSENLDNKVAWIVTYTASSPITSGDYYFMMWSGDTYSQSATVTITVPAAEEDNAGDNAGDDAGDDAGAPDTFDAFSVVTVLATVSAAGVVLAKKKR